MGRTTKEFTYTDGYYFCNVCDSPHEGETNAVDCFNDCAGNLPFICFKCEDTGLVSAPDPAFPNLRGCDILAPCECQKVER